MVSYPYVFCLTGVSSPGKFYSENICKRMRGAYFPSVGCACPTENFKTRIDKTTYVLIQNGKVTVLNLDLHLGTRRLPIDLQRKTAFPLNAPCQQNTLQTKSRLLKYAELEAIQLVCPSINRKNVTSIISIHIENACRCSVFTFWINVGVASVFVTLEGVAIAHLASRN